MEGVGARLMLQFYPLDKRKPRQVPSRTSDQICHLEESQTCGVGLSLLTKDKHDGRFYDLWPKAEFGASIDNTWGTDLNSLLVWEGKRKL